MIFLDESGKRWKRIKLGTRLVSSATLIPIGILSAAALLYVPGWAGFSLPLPFHVVAQKATPSVLSASDTKTTVTSPHGIKNSKGIASLNKPATTQDNTAITTTSAPTITTITPTTSVKVTQPTTPTTTKTTPNQTVPPGNSDYGHTHQPIRS